MGIVSPYMQVERWYRNFVQRNALQPNPLSYNNMVERGTNFDLIARLGEKANTDVPAIIGRQGSTVSSPTLTGPTSVGKPFVALFGSKLWIDTRRLYLSVGTDVINQGGETPLTKASAVKKSQNILVQPNRPTAGLQPLADDTVVTATNAALMLLFREQVSARKEAARALNAVLG